jgi:hypothetical protein
MPRGWAPLTELEETCSAPRLSSSRAGPPRLPEKTLIDDRNVTRPSLSTSLHTAVASTPKLEARAGERIRPDWT